MQITIFSVWMTFLWSSLLILFCYAFRKKSALLNLCSVTGVIFLYLFCLVRMLVPMEFPWTIPISGGGGYNQIYRVLRKEVFQISGHSLTIAQLLGGIWLAGVLVLLLLYARQYYKAAAYFEKMRQSSDPDVKAAFQKVCGETTSRIVVVQTPAVQVPCCMGLIRKRILIPDKNYTVQELYYIILHEYNHLNNHDILLMQLINILCILFWWNPFIYLLKKDMSQNIEMRCDQMVVKRISDEERAEYLEVILKEFQESTKERRTGYAGIAQLLELHGDGMVERFEKVAKPQEASKKGTIIICSIEVFLLVISYLWILQPYYEAPSEDYEYDEGNDKIDINDSYIYSKDGQYYIHCEQGDFLVDDKEHLEMLQKSGFSIKEEIE